MRRDGIYRRESARAQERRWIEEARDVRLAGIESVEDALRFAVDFGWTVTAHRKVYALKKEALCLKPTSSGDRNDEGQPTLDAGAKG
jgi:hypothetical protein